MTVARRPLVIGNVVADPPLVLAPMAGHTSLPLRLLCRRAGAGLVCTEMVSAMAIAQGNRKTVHLMTMHPDEHPVSVQLFGGEPDIMAAAVPVAEAAGADLIDINMGCGVPKVRRANAGVTLLAEPDRAVAVAAAMVRAARVPVTVKLRAGMEAGDDSYLDLACRLVDVGVAAISLHGRTAQQGFSGVVDLGSIESLITAVDVPVIGSGDVFTVDAVLRLLDLGCRGVMIARGAMGKPWFFRQAAEALRLGLRPGETERADLMSDPSWRERLGLALCHGQMLVLYNGDEHNAIHEMRGHVRGYTHGMPGGSTLRGKINNVNTLGELAAVFTQWASPETEDPWPTGDEG